MRLRAKYSDAVLNLLVAVAVSLVVNFSYLLLLLVERNDSPPRSESGQMVRRGEEGRLAVSPDGHGYLVYPGGDSVYVMQSRVRRLKLADGDRLVGELESPRTERGHPLLARIERRNGEEFDYSTLYNRPSEGYQLLLQLLYYLVVSFVMLSILTRSRHDYSARRFARRCLWCLLVAGALYLLAPVAEWHTGRIRPNVMGGRLFDYVLLLKYSFAVAVSMLYGRIYVLVSRQRAVELENEQLKNENLTTRYNLLVGQINPHFLFNSLNSLAMLVREGEQERALTYIDRLSYTFRYILQNGQSTLATVDEELRFAEAYAYQFRVRYEDKLFFDVDVDPRYGAWRLPALSLQPLIDNAVKHNAITSAHPLRVSIRTEAGRLVVSNPRAPKLERVASTGIGLENLRNRWHLIADSQIEVDDDGATFTVRLPLQPPAEA